MSKVLIYRDYGVGDLTGLCYGLENYFKPKGIDVEFTDSASIIKEDA